MVTITHTRRACPELIDIEAFVKTKFDTQVQQMEIKTSRAGVEVTRRLHDIFYPENMELTDERSERLGAVLTQLHLYEERKYATLLDGNTSVSPTRLRETLAAFLALEDITSDPHALAQTIIGGVNNVMEQMHYMRPLRVGRAG